MAFDWLATPGKEERSSCSSECGEIIIGDSVIAQFETSVFALVRRIVTDSQGQTLIRVKRYYTPEETVGGNQPFYGKKEFLLTDHLDTVLPSQIIKKIHVHSFVDYMMKIKTVGEDDYFFRFEYDIGSGWLSPTIIDVFCKCQMPFNPDMLSLMCKACKERYHPECINMTLDEAKQLANNFTCSDCLAPDNQDPSPVSSSAAATVDPWMVGHK